MISCDSYRVVRVTKFSKVFQRVVAVRISYNVLIILSSRGEHYNSFVSVERFLGNNLQSFMEGVELVPVGTGCFKVFRIKKDQVAVLAVGRVGKVGRSRPCRRG